MCNRNSIYITKSIYNIINNLYKEIEKMIIASFKENHLVMEENSLIDNDQFINLYHLILSSGQVIQKSIFIAKTESKMLMRLLDKLFTLIL